MGRCKFKHIIWDWNGTLLNDAWMCVEIMNGMLLKRGMPGLTHERYQEVFDFPVIDYYRRLGFDFEKEPFEISGTEFIVEYEKCRYEPQLQPEAVLVLNELNSMGISHSILSAYKQETLDDLLEHHGIYSQFKHVIGLNNHYAFGKTEQGKRLMEKLDCKPETVLFIGDTVHDFEVADSLGTACVLIPGGNHTEKKLSSCGVPVLKSIKEIIPFVNEKLEKSKL